MKSRNFRKRFYRDWVCGGALHETVIRERETDLHVLTDGPLDAGFALLKIRRYRGEIERYIECRDPRFLSSLKPIPVESTAPRIVREMAAQSRKAGVGPMAAVAGAIAQMLGETLIRKGHRDLIIENGGDVFLKVSRRVNVGIYAGSSRFSRRLRLSLEPGQTPAAICTSSGTVGHSLSFGRADSVTILARNGFLADACATAVGNRVSGKKDLAGAIDFARSVAGVRGVLIIFRDTLAGWGSIHLA